MKYWILILSAVCVLLMCLTFMTDFKFNTANFIVGYTVVPFQNGLSKVGGYLTDKAELLAQIKDLLAENEALQQQVDELTIENTALMQDKYELNTLRELYALDQQYSDYDKVGARIIMGGSNNWFDTFVINKGSNDGIEPDMNIMAGSGLVGRVVETGPNWAQVVSIIDDTSNVSATVLSTSDNLIVSGDLQAMENGYIRFSQLVDSDDKVVVGDKVVTSDISDRYQPGILIGYISYIEEDSNNLTKSGYITPAVDFEHLSEVLVITEQKQTID
jgi:rod shape-determining protein MreC